MRIVNLICLSAILLPLTELSVEARTIETTADNIKNQNLSVRKADFIEQNQWTTKASSLLAQAENEASDRPQDIANGSWSNSDEEEEPTETLFQLQQIGRRDFAPNRGAPGFTMANPYGFGADGGNAYVGIGFTPNSRNGAGFDQDDPDGVIGFGIGVGNARKAVGFELNYTMAGFGENRDFGTGGFSAKLHRTISTGWGIAAGWNGFLNIGDENDFQDSLYLATTKIFSTRENLNSAFSRVALTVGAGNGQFRTEQAIEDDEEGFNVFGSLAFRIARPVSGIIEWTGQDLAVGTSISPFKTVPVTFNLGLRDITGAGDGARFVLGVGAGF
ncbi:conserved exported hypothetical protein [Hyella patelloides LEGE 07179]|uniref:Autotransporter domain-containing protein n=1 Tax=Hyella patelloides LEGE 07179 TaxID=945734 RepID=A0A563VLK1_9CYAN|nr:hypothetical protein [Hyella patelloides]VEP12227.1 conserved exported hypothetical protein [Hyella patelloides LEGE 07179]